MERNYIVISKEIAYKLIGNNKNRDAYVYAYLKLCSDFKTGISNVKERTLSELTGIPEGSISEAIGRLKEAELLKVEDYFFRGTNTPVTRNRYYFDLNPADFFYVRNEFFYEDTEDELKGFLLRLKAICINDTNFTLYSVNRIAEELHSDNKTVRKYLDLGIEKRRIKELKKGFAILDSHILPRWCTDTRQDEIYDTISRYCILKGIIPPPMDKGLLGQLAVMFPESDAGVSDRVHEQPDRLDAIKNKYSLPRNLERKCRRLPKRIESLDYFITALGGKEVKPDYKPVPLLILD